MSDTIKLTINKAEFHFNFDTNAQERLVNEMRPDQKVAPMRNFLIRTVTEESKEALKPFLEVPIYAMQIAEKVLEGYRSRLDFVLGE